MPDSGVVGDVTIHDLAATLFFARGVDPACVVRDLQNQPHNTCDGQPVAELS